jgi:hypothetical protein
MLQRQARMNMMSGPLPGRLKLMHGFGSVAFGVKDGGFSFFLLPFYNLVLGVDAGIVGAADDKMVDGEQQAAQHDEVQQRLAQPVRPR